MVQTTDLRTVFEVLPFEVCEGFLLQLSVQTQDRLLQPHELLQPGELLVLQAPGGHGLLSTEYRTRLVQYRIQDTACSVPNTGHGLSSTKYRTRLVKYQIQDTVVKYQSAQQRFNKNTNRIYRVFGHPRAMKIRTFSPRPAHGRAVAGSRILGDLPNLGVSR